MSAPYLTLAQAAAELGLSPATLRTQAERGRLAAIKPGHDWLVTPAEVSRYRATLLGRRGRVSQGVRSQAVESQPVRPAPKPTRKRR